MTTTTKMADSKAPERVKKLFSSFLSNFNQKHSEETVDISSDDKTCSKNNRTDKQSSKDEVLIPEARNKMSFYERVESYSALTWFAKPLDLSPLVCARYGWKNEDTDMLQCVHCRVFLCGQLPKAVDTQVYRESCNKLKRNLTESHLNVCKWATNPSPELFMHVPYHNRAELESNFCHRITSLVCAKTRLPSVTYTSFTTQNLTEDKLEIYIEQILKNHKTQIQDNVPTHLALFALCGWSYSESQVDILHCNYCRRKIGLWNYSPVDGAVGSSNDESPGPSKSTEDPDDSDSEPVRKRPKIEKQSFDPIAEHRYWCPWLQHASLSLTNKQTGSSPHASPLKSPPSDYVQLNSPPSDKEPELETQNCPAWLLVAKILSHNGPGTEEEDTFCRQMKMSPQIESLRHLRRVLRDCTSPTSPTKMDNTSLSKES